MTLNSRPLLHWQREPLTVTINEAVRLVGISRSRMYELINAGDVSTVKLGGRRLVHLDSLQRLVGVKPKVG